MKTKIILFLSFVMIATAGFAQSSGKKKTFGFYIGPNFSNLNITSPNLSAANQSGFQVGAYKRTHGIIFTQAGLEYQKLNSNFVTTDSTGTGSGSVELNRIQMPLYVGVKALGIRAYAGPVISYTLNAVSSDPEFSIDAFNRFGVNGTVGAGLNLLIFTVDAGYTFGLTNLFSSNFNGKADYGFINVGLKF